MRIIERKGGREEEKEGRKKEERKTRGGKERKRVETSNRYVPLLYWD